MYICVFLSVRRHLMNVVLEWDGRVRLAGADFVFVFVYLYSIIACVFVNLFCVE